MHTNIFYQSLPSLDFRRQGASSLNMLFYSIEIYMNLRVSIALVALFDKSIKDTIVIWHVSKQI